MAGQVEGCGRLPSNQYLTTFVIEHCNPRNFDAWLHLQALFEQRIRDACAAVMARTKNIELLGRTQEQFTEKWNEAERSGSDKKEGMDALLRALYIEVKERLAELEADPGTDEHMRNQEAEWMEQYFLICHDEIE